MLALFVSVAVAALLLYPYAATVILRRRALKDLRKTVRRAGGRMRYLKKAVCLSRNRSRNYDLLIEKNGVWYAVKLWSALHRHTDLCIAGEGSIYEEREIFVPMKTGKRQQKRMMRRRLRQIPKTKYNFRLPKEKSVSRVLLVYPSYRSIRCMTQDGWREIGSGDILFDKTVYSPSAYRACLLGDAHASFSKKVSGEETSLKK